MDVVDKCRQFLQPRGKGETITDQIGGRLFPVDTENVSAIIDPDGDQGSYNIKSSYLNGEANRREESDQQMKKLTGEGLRPFPQTHYIIDLSMPVGYMG